jgi:hypothetical protein
MRAKVAGMQNAAVLVEECGVLRLLHYLYINDEYLRKHFP